MSERHGRKRHSPEQIIGKLREADAMLAGGSSIGQVCQRLEVSEATLSRWRNQYGGMTETRWAGRTWLPLSSKLIAGSRSWSGIS